MQILMLFVWFLPPGNFQNEIQFQKISRIWKILLHNSFLTEEMRWFRAEYEVQSEANL